MEEKETRGGGVMRLFVGGLVGVCAFVCVRVRGRERKGDLIEWIWGGSCSGFEGF